MEIRDIKAKLSKKKTELDNICKLLDIYEAGLEDKVKFEVLGKELEMYLDGISWELSGKFSSIRSKVETEYDDENDYEYDKIDGIVYKMSVKEALEYFKKG